jgi:hypothetical protein
MSGFKENQSWPGIYLVGYLGDYLSRWRAIWMAGYLDGW